jgi:serine/threonine protein kinase
MSGAADFQQLREPPSERGSHRRESPEYGIIVDQDEDDGRFKPGDILRAVGHTYSVVRILGEGGMGVVYEALDRSTDFRCALKILHVDHARQRGSIDARFAREARIPARLLVGSGPHGSEPHTSFVRVHHLGTLEGEYRPYYTMDLLNGATLKAVLKAAKAVARKERRAPGLPVDQALNIGLAICFGVDAMHARGVIHRDLKPDNIILHRDHGGHRVVKIIDYGIAHLESEGPHAGPAGTSTYAAREQYMPGGLLSTKVDVFAIGVMLFEMLAGVSTPQRCSECRRARRIRAKRRPTRS